MLPSVRPVGHRICLREVRLAGRCVEGAPQILTGLKPLSLAGLYHGHQPGVGVHMPSLNEWHRAVAPGPLLQGHVDHARPRHLLNAVTLGGIQWVARLLALEPFILDGFQAELPELVAWGAAHECIGDVVIGLLVAHAAECKWELGDQPIQGLQGLEVQVHIAAAVCMHVQDPRGIRSHDLLCHDIRHCQRRMRVLTVRKCNLCTSAKRWSPCNQVSFHLVMHPSVQKFYA